MRREKSSCRDSQGNLFANIAYKGIDEDTIDGFGIVSVANPSWYVAGDSSDTYYTTIEEDKVIAVIPFALRANIDNFPDDNPDDLSGHIFVNSYLASGHPAESKIFNDVVDKVYTLQWPEGGCKELLLITASVENGPRCVVLFDLDSNLKATNIPNNTGGYASFPCKESEISNWLSTVSKNGSSPLSIITGSPATHIDTLGYNDPDMQHSDEVGNLGFGCQALHCYSSIDTCTKNYPAIFLTYKKVEKGGSNMDDLAQIQFTETFSEYYENAPFLKNITLTSLTNFGGTKKRKNKGSFKNITDANLCWGWETVDFNTGEYTAGQYYPCSGEVPGSSGSKDEVSQYNTLTAESPFIDRTEIAITLERENKYNCRRSGWYNDNKPISCEALSKQESLSERYTCGGVLYTDRLIVFYTNEFTVNTAQRNATTGWVWNGGGLGGTPSECVNGFLTIVQPPYPDYEITYKKEFKLKAFSEKASPVGDTPGDAMNLDPFTIQGDSQIEEILKSLKSFAESISPAVPEYRCELLSISMSIVN